MSPYTSKARATTPERPHALISELNTARSGVMFCGGGHNLRLRTGKLRRSVCRNVDEKVFADQERKSVQTKIP